MSSVPLERSPDATHGDLLYAMHRLTWRVNRARSGYFAQDRLIERLATDPPVAKVLIADHPSSAPTRALHRLRQGRAPRPAAPGVSLTVPLRLRRMDPLTSPALERSYRRYGMILRARAQLAGMPRPHVLTTNAMFAAFGGLDWAVTVTYYGTDDFAGGQKRTEPYVLAYETLRRRPATRIAAVSQNILDAMGRPDGTVIPNGLDPDEWAETVAPPAWFAALPSPRLVYLGGMTDRLDVEAVANAAAAVPAGVVVLVGRVFDEQHVAPLRAIRNVVFSDPVDRHQVAGVLFAAQAGLVPHVIRRSTLAMSSLKAYEYLAAGLPIVSTPLPAIEAIGPRAVTATTERFGDAARHALTLGRSDDGARLEFVSRQSWRERHDRLFDLALGG